MMQEYSSPRPLVSVIIPCYNYGHLVHETLDSLKQQSFSKWECIIVNDGSSDNSEEVILKYAQTDARYKYFYQENKGMSAARNAGIAMASGKYIQLLDADDKLEQGKFAHQVQYLENNVHADIVYGDVKYFYPEAPATFYKSVTGTQQEWMPKVSGSGDVIIRSLIVSNIMAINCALIRKDVFLRAGTFNETLRHVEDWELFMRWAMKGVSFYYSASPGTAALVRIHSTSATADKWGMRYRELEMKEALYEQNLRVISQESLKYEIDKLRIALLLISISSLLQGRFGKALSQFRIFRKKATIAELRTNGARILKEKIVAALKLDTGHKSKQQTLN